MAWRQDQSEYIQVYELTQPSHTVQNLELSNHPVRSAVTIRDFYIDDIITRTNSIKEATNEG